MCETLDVPVVGGNVSLYNDSEAGPIPPTPTLLMVGKRDGVDAPPAALSGEGTIVLVGDPGGALGGSEYLQQAGGSDRFPSLPDTPAARIRALAEVANDDATLATHDVSNGGIGVALAEMLVDGTGATVDLPGGGAPARRVFCERPGRAIVQTTDPARVRERFEGIAPVSEVGSPNDDGRLRIAVDGETLEYDVEAVQEKRGVIERELA
jgi:phosphoribosylformylglycinamidine synthase